MQRTSPLSGCWPCSSSFDDARAELGVTEMATALGRAQVDRLTARRRAGAGRAPGPQRPAVPARVEIIRLGSLAMRSYDFVAALQPAMDQLSRHTGETINLAVPAGPES